MELPDVCGCSLTYWCSAAVDAYPEMVYGLAPISANVPKLSVTVDNFCWYDAIKML